MPLFTLAAELQSSEQTFGHTVLASQPVSRALGLSSLRQESPLLSSPPALHLRASPLPVKSLPLIEFSLLFILLSALFLSHCYPPLHPLSWAHLLPFLYCYRHQHSFFLGVFQRVSTFSILRCEIHFDTGLKIEWNRQYGPICFSLTQSLFLSSPLHTMFLFSSSPIFNPWIRTPTSLS